MSKNTKTITVKREFPNGNCAKVTISLDRSGGEFDMKIEEANEVIVSMLMELCYELVSNMSKEEKEASFDDLAKSVIRNTSQVPEEVRELHGLRYQGR